MPCRACRAGVHGSKASATGGHLLLVFVSLVVENRFNAMESVYKGFLLQDSPQDVLDT
jgi:hypothetical protein